MGPQTFRENSIINLSDSLFESLISYPIHGNGQATWRCRILNVLYVDNPQ